ncbi:hypothetical protein [Kitasatospora sp. NPDC008115]|uniref:hypothetical protein n=1 Tax=Kitasatospora sp. NPDC008115 TaxID=3364022 RepID=UPI0036E949FD
MQTWGERYQQGLADSAEQTRRARANAIALQRRSWARGEQVLWSPVTVTTPDGRPVDLKVVRTDVGLPATGATKKRGSRDGLLPGLLGLLGALSDLFGVLAFLGFVIGHRLFIELTGRPRWAVVATTGGTPVTVHRTRHRTQALTAAATLADHIERDGTIALHLPPPVGADSP